MPQNLQLPRRMGHAELGPLIHPADPGLGPLYNIQSPAQRHLEPAFDPSHGAALEDIVGQAPYGRKAHKQFAQDHRIVVYSPQENRLVAHGGSRPAQGGHRLPGLGGELPGVVELGDHIDGFLLPVPGQQLQQGGPDALRPGDRRAGAETDVAQMVDLRQRLQDSFRWFPGC